MAAFLRKRVGASAHVQSASGYAIVNWLQALLASGSVTQRGTTYDVLQVAPSRRFWIPVMPLCSGPLYSLASIWMQRLLVSRLQLLEISSSQEFCGSYLRWIVRSQACTASLVAILLCVLGGVGSRVFDGVDSRWFLHNTLTTTTIMKRAHTIENLDVRNMRASSETDKELILNKIENSLNID